MGEKRRIWQANLYIGTNEDEPITLYGESIADLRNHVAQWIISNEPEKFGNASPNYEITKRYNYSKASPDRPIKIPTYSSEPSEFTSGWIGVDGGERACCRIDGWGN